MDNSYGYKMYICSGGEVKAIAIHSEKNVDPIDEIVVWCATITEYAYIQHKS